MHENTAWLSLHPRFLLGSLVSSDISYTILTGVINSDNLPKTCIKWPPRVTLLASL